MHLRTLGDRSHWKFASLVIRLKHALLYSMRSCDLESAALPVVTSNQGPTEPSPEIIYEVRYQNDASGEDVYARPLARPLAKIETPPGTRPPVMKVVDVRITWLTAGSTELELGRSGAERQTVSAGTVSEQSSVAGKRVEEHDAVGKNHDEPGKVETVKLPPFDDDGIPYVEILSPAIREALRAVVDYYPEYNFDSKNLKIYWPYPVLTHYDEALERYQKRFENRECTTPTCSSQHAHKHISILRDFVRQKTGDSVDEERKRHERGYVTFEMLWLLFQPGDDVLYDMNLLGEPQPYVMKQLDWDGEGGSISAYSLTLWNIDADSEHIGPCDTTYQFNPFAGEKEITSLTAYPFKYFKRGKDGKTPAEVKKSLVERGKLFFELRKKGCWDFNGYGTTFPRRPVSSHLCISNDF